MNHSNYLSANQEAAASAAPRDARLRSMVPAVDIYEDSNGITLWVDLPGVPRDKLDVRVHDEKLFIEAEAVLAVPSELKLHHAEVRTPHFARLFSLSSDLDTERIDANLKDGVLRLSIPRREEARPRRITVQAS